MAIGALQISSWLGSTVFQAYPELLTVKDRKMVQGLTLCNLKSVSKIVAAVLMPCIEFFCELSYDIGDIC